jgi:hypothetical protein
MDCNELPESRFFVDAAPQVSSASAESQPLLSPVLYYSSWRSWSMVFILTMEPEP